MSDTYYLGLLVKQLTDARDTAFRKAEEARQRIEELREERANLDRTREDSIFAEIARDHSADMAREVALAEWAANALALSSLYLATSGEYGQLYDEQPSPYRRRESELSLSPQGVKQ